METTTNKSVDLGLIFQLNGILFLIGLITVALLSFNVTNILSFFLGAVLVTLNLYWLKRLSMKLVEVGSFKKKIAIEWALKVIVVFGCITLIVLKFKINILIFLFGLSILPIAVILSSALLYFKRE